MSDPVGEFNLKNTAIGFNTTADGQLQQTVDFEGTATGFGGVFGTLIITHPLAEAGATGGPCAWAGKALLDDNSILGGIGEGTWEQIGSESRFKVSMIINISDGGKLRSEGVIDHGARSYSGHLYDAS